MKTFNATIDGYNGEQFALDYARGMVWNEIETTEQPINNADHIETIDGVGVYYCYLADYYLFTDEIED